MHKHHGNHHNPNHHAQILMRGHHAGGDAVGNMPGNNSPFAFKKGGKPHKRRCHAEGGETGVNPVTGMKSPDVIARKRGGRACHAEGDTVAMRHGGHPRHHKRSHHAEGGSEDERIYSEGGKTKLKKGGHAKHRHRHHHADGDMAELAVPHKHGGRTHHKKKRA